MLSQLFALALLCCACSSSHSSPPSPATTKSLATGGWSGTWRDSAGNTGALGLAMNELDGEITAVATVDGSCVANIECDGTTNGYNIELHAKDQLTERCDVDAAFYEDGNRLIGTFDLRVIVPQGFCAGAGTFDLRRVDASQQPPVRGLDGELVIVDSDGNLVRRDLRVVR